MSDRCPACGQLLPTIFKVDLDHNLAIRGGLEVRLSPHAAVVVRVLHEARGQLVPRETLKRALWGAGAWPVEDDSILSQILTQARLRLAVLNVRVESVIRQGARLTIEEAVP